jgi:colicin import membrane protein
MATTKKSPGRPARSKVEVQQQFTDIRKEVAAAREAGDAKGEELEKQKDADARQAVEGLSAEGVVQKISGLGLEISRALAGISEKLIEEVGRLSAAREAVEVERKELERLHKIDVAATAVDQLVQDYAREKAKLDEEIAAQRAAWEQETETTERERKEQEEALKKQRQRESDDYEYKKALERKKATDKYEEEMRLLEKKNQERQETLEKSWHVREAALKEKEEEFNRLKKEADQFPARLQKEVERAVDQAVKSTGQQFEQQLLILKKDRESEQRLAEMRIKGLEDTIARQTAQITDLQRQLAEAKQQVQDIAVKAIEGASGARALAHVNQIAIEQAKQRSPQG